MTLLSRIARAALVPLGLTLGAATRPRASIAVMPNDNRHSVGTLANGVLTVSLETVNGVWKAEGESGNSLDVAAFAETGKGPTTPGPLIRVTVGNEVRATIRNTLDRSLFVYGFGKTARGFADSVIIAPNTSADVRFTATKPGTFFYVAKRGAFGGGRDAEDSQLHGVIVVDPPNAKRDPLERVMALSFYVEVNPKSRVGITKGTMAINGLSWPHTERLDYMQGDSAHWRVVNLTEADHPMHLHGFYFRVDAVGDGKVDTVYTSSQKRMAVTEVSNPYSTVTIAWQAARPGNWIYHCHYASHLSSLVALDTHDGELDPMMMDKHPSDAPHQMFGLVMGIRVKAKGPVVAESKVDRKIRIEQRERANMYGAQPGMAFAIDGTPESAGKDAMPIPGPVLVLERGKRVAVTTVNTSSQHATIHWHGIELESYPDGVPGWSGSGKSVLPSIKLHDSLTVKWTPTRTGAFMYHSHFNEAMQMGSGLYGPIIVLEPGQKYDPETDRTLFFATAGTVVNPIDGPFPAITLNGATQPKPMEFKAGVTYRLRFFNLAGDTPTHVSLTAGETPVQWRAVAKDGYPLPPAQAVMKKAVMDFDPGEIYEFEFTPAMSGELALTFGVPPFLIPPPKEGVPQPFPAAVKVAVRVR
jgi:FtsP/CotA-like multicopper oxidase with cupredoxin domain